jgi:hypothetical protein
MHNFIIFVLIGYLIKLEYGLTLRYYSNDGIYFYYDKSYYHRISKELFKQTHEIKILNLEKHGSDPY